MAREGGVRGRGAAVIARSAATKQSIHGAQPYEWIASPLPRNDEREYIGDAAAVHAPFPHAIAVLGVNPKPLRGRLAHRERGACRSEAELRRGEG